MQREPVDQLAATLLDTPFPVARLEHAAEGMLDLIRERIGRLSLVENRAILPFKADPAGRREARLAAGQETGELLFYERMFAARKRLAAALARTHGRRVALRDIDFPGRLARTRTDATADAVWEDAQWAIREGVAKPYIDDALATAVHRNLLLQLLTREVEDTLHQDPAELLTNQLTAAISDQLFHVVGDEERLLRYDGTP